MSPELYLTDVIERNDFKDAEHFYQSVLRNYRKVRFLRPNQAYFYIVIAFLSISIYLIVGNAVTLQLFGKPITFYAQEGSERPPPSFVAVIIGIILLAGFSVALAIIWLRKIKRKIGEDRLAFCWLFNCIQELDAYLYNTNRTHIVKANNLFRSYLEESDFNFQYYAKTYQPSSSGGSGDSQVLQGKYIAYFLESIRSKYDWITFTRETYFILDELGKLDSKLTSRIKLGIEINEIINILIRLALFEKAKFRPPFQGVDSNKINYRTKYFQSFIELLSVLPELNKKGASKSFSIKSRANKLLFSENIIVNFLVWYFVLQIAFLVIITLAVLAFNIKIDSTLIIGLTTTPFVTTAALMAFTYRRKK